MWTALLLAGCGTDANLLAGPGVPDAAEVVGDIADAGDAASEDADAFFAEGTIWDLHIQLPAEGQAALVKSPRVPVRATLETSDGTWPILLRLKGTSSFRDLSKKAAFKIDFRADDPEARFHGLARLTLDNMMQDSSMLHEHVAYWLARHRGVPASRHTYARVWVNDTLYGLYGAVEAAHEQLLANALPDDRHGNLYEGNVSDFVTGKTDHFDLEETDGLYPPYTDITDVITAIDQAPPERYTDTLASLFDLPELLDMWAIELATANPDGYAMNENNYMVYHGSEHWLMLPWGPDQGFQWYRRVHDFGPLRGQLIARCAAAPDCLDRLDATMLDLLDDWERSDLAAMVDNETALIQHDCDTDPRAELPCDTGHVAVFVAARPDNVRSELGGQ